MTDSDPNARPSQTDGASPETPEPEKPKPTFDVFPLTAEVKQSLAEMGYVHPTPVQLATYDAVTRGKDVIVQARTGTGKTTAFGLPIVDQVVRKSGGLQVLALAPTRELALQVAAEVAKIGKHRGVKVAAVYGGAPMGRQIAELEEGAQIVCGTPGRVLDHLRRGTMDPKGIRAFVLDEADEMLSMGFEKELSQIVERLPKQRQTLLFSATLTSDVNKLVRSMNEPETILLSGDQVGALDLKHYFYLQRGDKVRDLLQVIDVEDPPSAIVFCNTKDETERVAKELKRAGFEADYISGDLDQRERERVMQAVREGKLRFLVATDVAARGIDISHLTHVVNYDFPDTPEQYVHRTGRTGRAGRTGTAIALISPKDIGNLYYLRLTYGLKPIERTLPTPQELASRREADLVGKVEALAAEKPPSLDARALARRVLSHDDPERLVALLLSQVLGSQLLAAEEAAKARRARTPPPSEPEPATKPEARIERPREAREPREPRERRETRETRERREPRREPAGGERQGRGERDRRPRGVDALAEWSPPEEADDESPILARERRAASATSDAAKAEAPKPEAPPAQRPERGEERAQLAEVVTLFVSSGRRDGLRAGDLVEILERRAAIEADAVGRIRVRDRNTFVDVRPDVADRALAALKGVVVHGRTLNAERARPKDAQGAAPEPSDDDRPTHPGSSERH